MIGPKFCACTLLLSLVAIVLSGTFGMAPLPPVPSVSAAAVSEAYMRHAHQVLIFAVLTCASVALFIPACCGLSVAMLRMEPRSLFFAVLQGVGGVFALIAPFIAGMVMAVAVVRPGTSAQAIVSLNDFAVILIELSTFPALFQGGSLAYAIFRDQSPDPILPKWYGWTSIVWAIIAQGGVLAAFFDTGPFAADGAVGIVLPMLSLFVWMLTTIAVLLRIKPEQWIQADGECLGVSAKR